MLAALWGRAWDPWGTLPSPTGLLGYPQDILRSRQHAQTIDIPWEKGMLANAGIMSTGHQNMLTVLWDRAWDPRGTLTSPTGLLGYP